MALVYFPIEIVPVLLLPVLILTAPVASPKVDPSPFAIFVAELLLAPILNAPVEDTEGVVIPALKVSRDVAVSGIVFLRYKAFAAVSVKPEPVPVSDVKKDGLKGIPL